jgi:hypothetical protein
MLLGLDVTDDQAEKASLPSVLETPDHHVRRGIEGSVQDDDVLFLRCDALAFVMASRSRLDVGAFALDIGDILSLALHTGKSCLQSFESSLQTFISLKFIGNGIDRSAVRTLRRLISVAMLFALVCSPRMF